MSTTTTPVRPATRERTEPTMPLLTPGSYDCDRSECPAPGTQWVVIHGQDFYFCGHHWREMAAQLTAAGSRATGGHIPF